MPFFLIFLIIPLIEIALFKTVGDHLGLSTTLLLCLLTALIGSYYVRSQGTSAYTNAQNAMKHNKFPLQEAFDGVCLAAAGITLITPGFFTDALGFLLLIPPLRVALKDMLLKKFKIFDLYQTYQDTGASAPDDDIIEVEYTHIETKNAEDSE